MFLEKLEEAQTPVCIGQNGWIQFKPPFGFTRRRLIPHGQDVMAHPLTMPARLWNPCL